MMDLVRISIAGLIALGLAVHGYKKKSLSLSGSLAAIVVGFVSCAFSYRYGMLMIAFYYSSSKLTKLKEKEKAKLGELYEEGAQRTYLQVLSCSLASTIVIILHLLYCGYESEISFEDDKVKLEIFGASLSRNYLAAQLACAYIAHFAVANGDTWASEVGILSVKKPRLITSFFVKEVPRGTNGGVSLEGTLASVCGGAFIGFIYCIFSIFSGTALDIAYYFRVIAHATFSGFLGSMIDSLLGATVQASYYSPEKNKVLKGKNHPNDQLICGRDILSNESVNFVSIVVTMLLSVWYAPIIFCS